MAKFAAPLLGLGLALCACFWVAAWYQAHVELSTHQRKVAQDLSNLSLVVELTAARIVDEADRTLKHLQAVATANEQLFDGRAVTSEVHRASEHTAFIFILDVAGRVVFSSNRPASSVTQTFADRPYFRTHADTTADRLFISRTMPHRLSGEPAIFLSRRYTGADGRFAGVIVLGLDPNRLAQTYHRLELGPESGVAIVGDDGIVRAGTGIFQSQLDKGFREGLHKSGEDNLDGSGLIHESFQGQPRTVAYRKIQGYPLIVLVVSGGGEYLAAWNGNRLAYFGVAFVLSLLVLATVGFFCKWHLKHVRVIRFLAFRDSLTGLANRARFRNELERAYAEVDDQEFALLLVDLDGFKEVNDQYGHLDGDVVIVTIAQRLRQLAGPRDFIARLGGDEFVILRRGPYDSVGLEALAARICTEFARPITVKHRPIAIGASVGITRGQKTTHGTSEIIRRADVALYAAKAGGRSTWRVYGDGMEKGSGARQGQDVAAGIAAGEFLLHYQPIVDMGSGATVGYEALVRWNHPVRGRVHPAEFIPEAEASGAIVPLGEWVIETALATLAQLPSHLHMAVNVSAAQFVSGRLLSCVCAALAAHQLDPRRIMLEITETAILKRTPETVNQLRLLRSLGVGLAIDDFGEGHSSIGYLHELPISCLKIDRRFVTNIAARDASRGFVRGICALARELEVSVVAEGVETDAERETLTQLGCAFAQGYLYGRPAPLKAEAADAPAQAA